MIKRVLGFNNPAYLSLKNGQMVVTLPDIVNDTNMTEAMRAQGVHTLPIEDIGVIVLDHKQITITAALMAFLLENNVAIINCNDQHLPVGLLLPLDGNNLQNERFRQQIDASEPLKKQMWQQTVSSKIAGQAQVLALQGVENGNMVVWSKQVRSGDPDNLEARAAAYYWRNVFHKPDFIRGQEGDPPNNLLNYGYAIVRAMMARALVAAGVLPTLGIHHHNKYNAYCLADDIMEPYRPYVDRLVYEITEQYGVDVELSKDIKAELLSIPTLDVVVGGKRSPLMVAASQTTASLYKCYSGELRKIVYPEI